ncbi:hypothetical protein DFJ74DRAFT_771289, partial [Hyaloraphidium curvatum]
MGGIVPVAATAEGRSPGWARGGRWGTRPAARRGPRSAPQRAAPGVRAVLPDRPESLRAVAHFGRLDGLAGALRGPRLPPPADRRRHRRPRRHHVSRATPRRFRRGGRGRKKGRRLRRPRNSGPGALATAVQSRARQCAVEARRDHRAGTVELAEGSGAGCRGGQCVSRCVVARDVIGFCAKQSNQLA